MDQATILTPEALHDNIKTRQTLAAWGQDAVTESLQALLDKKLVVRSSSDRDRIVPGRNYRLSEKYLHFNLL